MSFYNVVNSNRLVAGLGEDVGDVLSNFQAIAAVLNGALDNSNLSAGAAIAASKLAGYPTDGTKALFGDGTWKVPSGAGGGGAMVQLKAGVLGADALTIDLTAIPTTSTHMLIYAYLRSASGGNTDDVKVRFNNDSGATYEYENTQLNAGVATDGGGSTTGDGILIAKAAIGAAQNANLFNAIRIFIPNYSATTGYKQVEITGAIRATNVNPATILTAGLWKVTTAISRVTISSGSGSNLKSGSVATVYGVT